MTLSKSSTILSIILISSCAAIPPPLEDSFSKKDLLFHSLNALDTYQTVKIGRGNCPLQEIDPITSNILGSKPEEKKTIAYFLATSVGYQITRDKYNDRPVVRFLLDLFLLGKATTVHNNQQELNKYGC